MLKRDAIKRADLLRRVFVRNKEALKGISDREGIINKRKAERMKNTKEARIPMTIWDSGIGIYELTAG